MLWLKLPIYFIIWRKVMQISGVYGELKSSNTLSDHDAGTLITYMGLYGVVFVLLLFS